jgi:hypothetical protein
MTNYLALFDPFYDTGTNTYSFVIGQQQDDSRINQLFDDNLDDVLDDIIKEITKPAVTVVEAVQTIEPIVEPIAEPIVEPTDEPNNLELVIELADKPISQSNNFTHDKYICHMHNNSKIVCRTQNCNALRIYERIQQQSYYKID